MSSYVNHRRTVAEQTMFAPHFVPYDICGGKPGEGSGRVSVKKAGNNRILIAFKDGTQAFMLHATVIAWRLPNGRVWLGCGGYKTQTSRVAMLEAQEMFGVVNPRNYSAKSLPEGEWVQ